MKLISMHVDDFGGLHNYDYTFGEGLNVVLHDNGWGKTTMAAFLKAMLYGYDTRRSKDITENERKRYLPWQGGKYGGSLEFESEGVRYRITRTFGETPRFDTAKIINLDTKTTAKIPADRIGETLFHLDANAFQRSVFINQNGLSIDGAASSIHTRLNALVSQANDVAAYDGAVASLTQHIKIYEKTGSRGQLGDITHQIAERERLRDQLERDIAHQDQARERIIEIDVLLGRIEKDLEEKNRRLDAAAGEAKKQEAAKKLLEDLRGQIAVIQQTLDATAAELGGHVPTDAEIDQNKRSEQAVASLKAGIRDLEAAHAAFTKEYEAVLQKYGGTLPTPAQLDEIQAIYGEIQGIISADASDAALPEAPEGYGKIRTALETDPAFVDALQTAVDSRTAIQNLVHQRDSQAKDLQQETEEWAGRTKRYAELRTEADTLAAGLASQSRYSPAAVEPVIRNLEDCGKKRGGVAQQEAELQAEIQREAAAWADQKKRYGELTGEAAALQEALERQAPYAEARVRPAITSLEALRKAQQRVDEKREALPAIALTPEEEALLADIPDSLPDAGEGADILAKHRSAAQRQAAAQGIMARLDGEKSKADSLKASLAQLESVTSTRLSAVDEPQKPGAALMVIGILLIIAGAALGVVMTPALAAIAAVGLALCVAGAAGKRSYQKKLQAYEAYQQADAHRQEADRKRAELKALLTAEQSEIAGMEKELDEHRAAIDADSAEVTAWLSLWGQPVGDVSEAVIVRMMDRAAAAGRLRDKRAEADAVQRFITEQTAAIDAGRTGIDALYPECAGKPIPEAIELLRAGETNYKIAQDKLQSAVRSREKYLSDAKITESQLTEEDSPRLAALRQRLEQVGALREGVTQARAQLDGQYPEIAGLPEGDAAKLLQSKLNDYNLAESQLKTAERNLQRFIAESGAAAEDLALPESPELGALAEAHRATVKDLEDRVGYAEPLLRELDLDTDPGRVVESLREAEAILNEYRQYEGKLNVTAARRTRNREQMDALRRALDEKRSVLHAGQAGDDLPALLAAARTDIGHAAQVSTRIADTGAEINRQKERLDKAEQAVGAFHAAYGHFAPDDSGISAGIYARAHAYAEKLAAKQELEKQGASVTGGQPAAGGNAAPDEEEAALRAEVEHLKERRDSLLIEYTQTSDAIRQADLSLEKYPDLVQEIHRLYEQKQKAQNTLGALKRTIQLITRAKENLANRYLSKVEQLFNSYMQVWLNNDAVRGLLDIDFNVSIEENGKTHVAEGYSTGYCDMIDFCMRLALVDTLFEKEQPFLILDDPFVNLDADRLEKALELLNVMAANKQVVYFVCHPIRAVETAENAASRAELLKLAEATRATINSARAEGARTRAVVRKSPREMYRVTESSSPCAIRPANLNYTITNSIFSMPFVTCGEGPVRDHSFELFFIDAAGRVLNDRQMIEVSNGKLSTDRVQFSLNTRDDSGDTFELMIRESGQDDYEVAARYPFRAKLAFTGTFSFDF